MFSKDCSMSLKGLEMRQQWRGEFWGSSSLVGKGLDNLEQSQHCRFVCRINKNGD